MSVAVAIPWPMALDAVVAGIESHGDLSVACAGPQLAELVDDCPPAVDALVVDERLVAEPAAAAALRGALGAPAIVVLRDADSDVTAAAVRPAAIVGWQEGSEAVCRALHAVTAGR